MRVELSSVESKSSLHARNQSHYLAEDGCLEAELLEQANDVKQDQERLARQRASSKGVAVLLRASDIA